MASLFSCALGINILSIICYAFEIMAIQFTSVWVIATVMRLWDLEIFNIMPHMHRRILISNQNQYFSEIFVKTVVPRIFEVWYRISDLPVEWLVLTVDKIKFLRHFLIYLSKFTMNFGWVHFAVHCTYFKLKFVTRIWNTKLRCEFGI